MLESIRSDAPWDDVPEPTLQVAVARRLRASHTPAAGCEGVAFALTVHDALIEHAGC